MSSSIVGHVLDSTGTPFAKRPIATMFVDDVAWDWVECRDDGYIDIRIPDVPPDTDMYLRVTR